MHWSSCRVASLVEHLLTILPIFSTVPVSTIAECLRADCNILGGNKKIFFEFLETRRLFLFVCVCLFDSLSVQQRIMPQYVMVLYLLLYPCTNNIISHKLRLMHTYCSVTLLTLCHSDMFQPSKGHLRGVRLIRFNSRVNKMSYQT